jgi:hypothetical protein
VEIRGLEILMSDNRNVAVFWQMITSKSTAARFVNSTLAGSCSREALHVLRPRDIWDRRGLAVEGLEVLAAAVAA